MDSFKEKDLEDLLWLKRFKCYDAGLDCFIDHASGCQVQRFRQPQLGPYGIGDILEITMPTNNNNRVEIRVIECKRGVIGLTAYAQCKRYLTAAKVALSGFAAQCTGRGFPVTWKCILIGSHVDTLSDFLHVLNHDAGCEAYAYGHVGAGISFTRAGQAYLKHDLNNTPSALNVLGKRAEMGAQQAQEEVDRVDAQMAIDFPQEYWDNLFGRKS
jgi:hypothetical protein